MAPTPEVEVKGVVTSSPAGGSDSFTATTLVVAPREVAPLAGGSDDSRVNVTSSFPIALLSGADTCTVDSQTKVLGNTNLVRGDVVAGGLIGPAGESESTVGSTPPPVLGDWAPSMSSSAVVTASAARRAERRALEMLRQEKAKLYRHHEKFKTDRK